MLQFSPLGYVKWRFTGLAVLLLSSKHLRFVKILKEKIQCHLFTILNGVLNVNLTCFL